MESFFYLGVLINGNGFQYFKNFGVEGNTIKGGTESRSMLDEFT